MRIENEEMRDGDGEGKSDGCDRRVSIARDAGFEVDYSGPCGLRSIRAVGMKNHCTPASLTHTLTQ